MISDRNINDPKRPCLTQAVRVVLSVLAVTILLGASTVCGATTDPVLTDSDCGKCHKQPAKDIATLGGAHKSEMGCLGCHVNHPPKGETVIPECAECHDSGESVHFALSNCAQCHSPHAPLIKTFTELGEVKTGCLSCHPQIGIAMQSIPSMHAAQDCSECHQAHGLAKGQFMNCLECHEGHSAEMGYTDCLSCHNPHQPTDYQWSSDTNTKLCSACHAEAVASLSTNGGAHASDISCSDCHQNHPPTSAGVIPACADCHAPGDNPHFKVENCTSCHNPHEPLEIDLSAVSPIKPVCLTCHAKPGLAMQKYPSAHAEMDCNECHQQHGEYQQCLECHSGHSDDMVYSDCLRCHQPHQPTHLEFAASGVDSKLCGSCHKGQLKQLSNNTSKHAGLQCIYCHKRTHKVILSCDNCHGQPHDSSIHQKFEDCSTCHKGPHNLRN